ncbi:MAG: hypothetical protein JXR77_03450, partial [Lentisphaeria bacterium]|nr:hypothetical protein [Lentisphaeria bacterium]
MRLDTTSRAVDGKVLIGVVYGGPARTPVAGATIVCSWDNLTTQTKQDGTYSLPLPSSFGGAQFTVSAPGFVTYRMTTIFVGWDRGTHAYDFFLQPVVPPARQPVVRSLRSQYGELFPVLDGVAVTNRYSAQVDWNGTPGTLRFQAPGQALTASGSAATEELSVEFDMGTAFDPVASVAPGWRKSNPLVVTAINGEGQASAPVTVYPGVFRVPEWVIGLPNAEVTMAVGHGGWEFGVDARYPASPVMGMTDVPEWVPFIGGQFGLESTQAILQGEFRSASSSGRITVSGGTGFRAGGMGSVAGSAGGGLGFTLGDAWSVDGLFGLTIEGEVSQGLGVLECVPVPAVQVFAQTPGGQLVNDRVMLFAEVSPEVALEVAFGLLSAEGGGWDLGFKGTDVEIGVGLTGGVEIDLTRACRVRGYAEGTPKVFLHFPGEPEWFTRAEVCFRTGVQVKSFFDTVLLKAEKVWYLVLYDSAEGARRAASDIPGAIVKGKTVLVPQTLLSERNTAIRGPQEGGYVFLSADRKQGNRGTETVLLADAFSECRPSLAVDSGRKLLVFVADTAAKADLQSTEIQYSLDTGTGWSVPTAITADTHLDCSPQVAFDEGGNAVSVWLRSRHGDLTDPAAVEPEMEVAYAVLDAASGTWTSPQFLTDNTYVDYGARLVRGNDGSLLLVWAANEGNEIVGTAAHPTRLLARRWDGTSTAWGPEIVAVEGTEGIGTAEFSAAWSGTAGEIVFVRDGDLDFGTGDDTELVRVSFDGTAFSAPVAATADAGVPVADRTPELACDSTGVFHLAWLREEQLLLAEGLDIANATVVRDRGKSTGLTGFRLIRSAEDSLFVVWPDDTDGQADLWCRAFDPVHRVWGRDGRLTNDTAMEKAVDVAVEANGELLLAYAKTAIIMETVEVELEGTRQTVTIENVHREGATDLVLLRHAIEVDLRVGAIELDPGNPAPGEEVQIAVRVANAGDGSCGNVAVALYDGDPADGGTCIGEVQTLAEALPGQSEAVLAWTWTVPDGDRSRVLWAVADPEDAVPEPVEENNAAQRAVVLADPAAVAASARWLRDNVYVLSATLRNAGVVSTGPFSVRFLLGDESAGVEIGSVYVAGLLPGWEDVVPIEWDAGGTILPAAVQAEILLDGAWVESDVSNNTATMQVNEPVLRIPPAPSGLAAVPTVHQVHLTWTDNAEDEDGFRLTRGGGPGGEEEIGFVGAGVTAYTDDTVEPGTEYTYAVFAYNATGMGETSAPVTTRTLTDTDGDELPDEWEQAIVDADADDDLNGVGDVFPEDDFDGDGASNLAEFLGGSNPTDPGSLPVYTLTYTAGAHGTVAGDSPQTVEHGSAGTAVTAVPDGCHGFVQWSDGSTANPRQDKNVTADIAVTAEFAILRYTLTYTAGANGTITGPTPQVVDCGSNGQAVTAEPAVGFSFIRWSDGVIENPRQDWAVSADVTVTAEFADVTPPGAPGVCQETGAIDGVGIHSVSDEFTGSGWDLRAIHIVDSSGLSGDPPVHAQTVFPGGESWQTGTSSGTGSVAFDLGAPAEVARAHVWNLNFYPPYHGRGARDVAVFSSLDGVVWNGHGTVTFPIATGADGDPGFDLDASSWGETRYIRFDILSNFGLADNAGHVGLSEVQFLRRQVQGRPTWAWSGSGGGVGEFRIRLDNENLSEGAILTQATWWTPHEPLSHGPHTLYVQERDDAGNWSASGSLTIDVIRSYTVTFQEGAHGALDGGTPDVEITVEHGDPAPAAPAVTADACWDFAGWAPALPATITEDVETTAQYTQQTYTVTFRP